MRPAQPKALLRDNPLALEKSDFPLACPEIKLLSFQLQYRYPNVVYIQKGAYNFSASEVKPVTQKISKE